MKMSLCHIDVFFSWTSDNPNTHRGSQVKHLLFERRVTEVFVSSFKAVRNGGPYLPHLSI